MFKQISLCAILLALTATLNAQTYEYSGKPKDGFHAATLGETLLVIKQVAGLNNGLHLSEVQGKVDAFASYESLNASGTEPLKQFLGEIGNMNAIAYDGGVVLVQLDPRGSVLRFASWKLPTNLYVRKIADAPPEPKSGLGKIDPALLKMFIEILTPEQRVQFFVELQKYGVEQPKKTRARRAARSGLRDGYDEY